MSLLGPNLSSGLNLNPTVNPQAQIYIRWTPHPIIVAIKDNKDYIRVLSDSQNTTITGWGVLLRYVSLVYGKSSTQKFAQKSKPGRNYRPDPYRIRINPEPEDVVPLK